jgi:hypothetical protein
MCSSLKDDIEITLTFINWNMSIIGSFEKFTFSSVLENAALFGE